MSRQTDEARVVEAQINYLGDMRVRPKFHAQDHRRDNLTFDPHVMPISDARTWSQPPTLDREGVALVRHRTAVTDFRDAEEVSRIYAQEIKRLILETTGASDVVVVGGGGNVRYTERSAHYGTGMNTRPARFPHVDFTPNTAPGLVDNVFGTRAVSLAPGQRLEGYNIWRVFSPPPQDVPLAVCDSRSVAPADLVPGDGVYDQGEDPASWPELEAYLVRHSPRHRWLYFRDMQPDEALLFRSYDNGPQWRAGVAHSAFNDPGCPPGVPARMSIEARAIAVF